MTQNVLIDLFLWPWPYFSTSFFHRTCHRSLFVLLCFSFGHCVVCSSSIYGLWLPLWYIQTLLENGIMNEAIQFLWDIWLTWYHNQERWQNKRINKLGIANCKTRPHFLPLNYSSYHDMQNNLKRTGKWLRQVEHIRGHLWNRYSIAVKIKSWWRP
jgi:hypothetical protein